MRSSDSNNEVKIRSKLKDVIVSKLAASNPSMPVNPDVIHLRLQHFFPTFHTPIHPPYSLMIQEAISKLNEEGGSSEEAISRFLEKEYEGLPWGHASFLSHHLKKLRRNGEILCINNERYMLHLAHSDLRNEEEMSHGLNIANRDGKEDQTLVHGKGREVEAIDGWSGVNSNQAEQSEDQFEVERQIVELNGKNKACEQRMEGFEEQKEGRQELIKEVQEESQNFSGQIEVDEEVDKAKGKPAEVARKQRGRKRKQPEKTEQRTKVLKDDIPRLEEQKKCVEEQQQQIKGGSRAMKSIVVMIGEHEQPQRSKMISEQGLPQDQKIDIRTKKPVFSCGREDRENLKTSVQKRFVHLLEEEKDSAKEEEEKKEALEHEGQQRLKLHHRESDSTIICALPAQQHPQSSIHFYQKAHKLRKDSVSASLESSDSGQIRLKQFKLSSRRRRAKLKVTTSGRFTQSKQKPAKFHTRKEIQNSWPKLKTSLGLSRELEELENKQRQQLEKPEKLLEFGIKTKEANFSGEEAAVSLSIEVKDSMNAPLDPGKRRREHPNKQIRVYVRRNVSKSR